MPWKLIDEAEPPKDQHLLVWNGEHVALARRRRTHFVARNEGMDVLDPWEKPCVLKGVTHWQPLPRPPR